MESDGRELLRVEVIHAKPGVIWRRCVDLPPGGTALQAVQASGLIRHHPEWENQLPPLGIYGRVCEPHQRLQPGDRVEVYRPLVFDPMESRRRRQRHRQRKTAAEKAAG